MPKRTGLALALTLAMGCVNQATWTPTVDTYGDKHAYRLSQDEAECRQLAMQTSGTTMRKTAKGGLLGGLGGAAAGAAIGAAAGDAGMGAAVGAATVGIGAAAYEGLETNSQFKRVFSECLQRRGHNVLSHNSESASGSVAG